MDFIEAAKTAKDALEDKKAEDIKILDLRNLSSVAECFVIASGNNINQLAGKANAGFASRDEVTRALRMLDRVYELMYGFSK